MTAPTPTTDRAQMLRRIDGIFTAAYALYGLTREQLRSFDRTDPICMVRQETMAALYILGLPFARCGQVLGRELSTACHAYHIVLADPARLARAQELARGGGREDFEPLLARALTGMSTVDIAAIHGYITVCVLGERNWRIPGTQLAWGLRLLREGGHGVAVARVLRLCGLEDGAAVLVGQLARRAA